MTSTETQNTSIVGRESLKSWILTTLGGEIVDIPLDNVTLNNCVATAFAKYRQLSSASTEEGFEFFFLKESQSDYILNDNIIEVRKILRRRMGTGSAGDGTNMGMQYDPFDIAFTNMFLLQSGGMGGLASFNFYNQYLNTAGKMFGTDINFLWNPATKRLQIARNPSGDEEVMLWVHRYVPDEQMLNNVYTKMWIYEYALAYAKLALGNAYEQYANLAGPQGGVQLNGAALKTEAKESIEKLELQLKTYGDGQTPTWFCIG